MDRGCALPRAAIEHMARMIDHARVAFGAHCAAAERMRGRRLVAHDAAGERVLDIAAAHLADECGKRRVEALVDGLIARVRPDEGETIAVEPERAAGAVV